jgi:hypothetical protein
LILGESSLGYPPLPTTCAADGSYAIERLLSVDLAAAAAVAMEGLTPPSEKRFWEQPRHSVFIVAERHNADTATVLRAVMIGHEMILASRAPHDLVMIDGTLTLPTIYFNQALNQAPASPQMFCSQEFVSHCVEYLEAYSTILTSRRSDKNFIGVPKYSTRREIGDLMGWPGEHDDRGFLTMLLKAGELTKPIPLAQPDQAWHFNVGRLPQRTADAVKALASDITDALSKIHVFYYKPHDWLPALRIEVAPDIANNQHRLGSVVYGIKHQCATAAMLEPYPLYLADRTVKAMAKALPAFRQVTTQRISEKHDGDVGEIFFAMHGYRSEAGA